MVMTTDKVSIFVRFSVYWFKFKLYCALC